LTDEKGRIEVEKRNFEGKEGGLGDFNVLNL